MPLSISGLATGSQGQDDGDIGTVSGMIGGSFIRKMKRILVTCLLLSLFAAKAFAQEWPKSKGWVNDFAGVIDANTRERLESILAELEQKTQAEVTVVTVSSVADGDIERAAVSLFESWKVGKKGKDNGVLILCAIQDRRVRIEVGYGLEGILPDALCGRIIREKMVPNFRNGDYSTGLLEGTLAVVWVISQDAGVGIGGVSQVAFQDESLKILPVAFVIFLLFFILAYLLRRAQSNYGWYWMGSGGGWGGGDFGGGFGGFGGGSSGGGGASGSW